MLFIAAMEMTILSTDAMHVEINYNKKLYGNKLIYDASYTSGPRVIAFILNKFYLNFDDRKP